MLELAAVCLLAVLVIAPWVFVVQRVTGHSFPLWQAGVAALALGAVANFTLGAKGLQATGYYGALVFMAGVVAAIVVYISGPRK
ncbi:hypothetical protein [Usitatibacter palustris]|uniref:Uncharacterized protein n=1 Tax=Usitatibacter palustris TaxID=2732487 RepID=A0A6M4H231_9PROT|nr:hypothetical protein [Usitatibacter palustris]QJR13405.1 hypothetical protein DSM104440_00188 [Usitatibacter palustris]